MVKHAVQRATHILVADEAWVALATLHTNSAPEAINRIIDVFPQNQQAQIRTQLSTALIGVLSQTLIPRKSGEGVVAAYEMLMVTPAVQNLIRRPLARFREYVDVDMRFVGRIDARLVVGVRNKRR